MAAGQQIYKRMPSGDALEPAAKFFGGPTWSVRLILFLKTAQVIKA